MNLVNPLTVNSAICNFDGRLVIAVCERGGRLATKRCHVPLAAVWRSNGSFSRCRQLSAYCLAPNVERASLGRGRMALLSCAPKLSPRSPPLMRADVDTNSRFPAEAFAALREQRLLGILIPTEFGGEGARAADVADVCAILGAACASTAMIFAMHQVKLACLIRHHRNNPWQLGFLRKCAEKQLLLASSTTEGMNGGNIRSSEAAIQLDGPRVLLTRDASCISYGAEADAIVTTARRGESAANSDQVLAVFEKNNYTLERTKSWDTLGMRGTCSVGYMLQRRRRGRSGARRAVRSHPHSDDGALRASVLVLSLVRRRHRRLCNRPGICSAGLAAFRRPHAAGRATS